MNRKLLYNYQNFVELRTKTRKQFVYSPFASTFKNARLSLGKTLFAVVGSTCSLSYVSKYENNLLLPDEDTLRVLFENVGLNYELMMASDMTDCLADVIKAYLRNDLHRLSELYEKAQLPYFVAQNVLANCFYHLAHKEYEQCAKSIEQVDDVKTTLNDYQILVLSSATIELYIATGRYREAFQLLQVQKNMYKEYPEVKALYHEQRFLVALNLKDDLHILPFYNDLQKGNLYTYPLKKQIRNKMLYLETQWEDDQAYQEITDMGFDYIPEEYATDYIYSQYVMMIRRHNLDTLIHHYQSLPEKHPMLIALYAYAIRERLQVPIFREQYQPEKGKLALLLQQLSICPDYQEESHFIKLLLMQMDEVDPLDTMDFMKATILPEIELRQHRFYTEYYVKTYLELLEKCSRYKEATLFTKKYIRYVKNLKFEEF